ncbi:MAG: transglutaminase-like cysteine peptidase [Methylophilus sp.]|nr:transglutaminase-like cysteine peptidase [Methylophilus sp.]
MPSPAKIEAIVLACALITARSLICLFAVAFMGSGYLLCQSLVIEHHVLEQAISTPVVSLIRIMLRHRMMFLIMAMSACVGYLYAGGVQFDRLGELAKQRYGEQAQQHINELNQVMTRFSNASDEDKLIAINGFFNQKLEFVEDIHLWKTSDYWATPLESIGKQAGDCEDFSIAKYVFLKALNIPNEKLRLTYVRAQLYDQDIKVVRAHMVLSYYKTPTAEPLVLDNLTPEILPASQRPDLNPIFSFNDKGLWVGGSTKPKASSQQHLSKWRDVLLRIRADGIE